MFEYNDWDEKSNNVFKEYKLPEKVDSIEVGYDRGRFTMVINGETIIKESCMGDISLYIDNDTIEDHYEKHS